MALHALATVRHADVTTTCPRRPRLGCAEDRRSRHHRRLSKSAPQLRLPIALVQLAHQADRYVLAERAGDGFGALDTVPYLLNVAKRRLATGGRKVELAHPCGRVEDGAKPTANRAQGQNTPAKDEGADDEVGDKEPVTEDPELMHIVVLRDEHTDDPVMGLRQFVERHHVALPRDTDGEGVLRAKRDGSKERARQIERNGRRGIRGRHSHCVVGGHEPIGGGQPRDEPPLVVAEEYARRIYGLIGPYR